jgi:ketohexokinase
LICPLPAADCADAKFIRASLPGVDLSWCVERKECQVAASSTIFRSTATGSRTIISFNQVPELTALEFDGILSALPEINWWHFEGRIPDVTLKCVEAVRKQEVTSGRTAMISLEIEKPGREGLLEIATRVDVIFYSKGWVLVSSIPKF